MMGGGDYERASVLCEERYDRSGDVMDLVWSARARVSLEDWEGAKRVARRVLGTSRYGDAHGALGYVALREMLPAAARVHAQAAFGAHLLAGDENGQASDNVMLSQAAWQIGDYETALAAADRAIALVEKLGPGAPGVPAYLARADALRWMGDTHSAVAALRDALAWAHTPCKKAWVRLRNGMAQMALGQDAIAEVELAIAERENTACNDKAVARQISVTQAWLMHEREPAGALARLDEVWRQRGGEEGADSKMLRSYIAADRGDLDEVGRHLQKAATLEPPHANWPWGIALARAELLEARGGLLGDALSLLFYRSSTAMVAALRSNARERSAYLVASHRAPYDGLISLWARYGRWREALAVVLELDASDMLRATANQETLRTHLQSGPAGGLVALDAARAKPASVPSVEAVLEAWRGRELVIVAARTPLLIGKGEGKERVYRLHLRDGEVTGVDAGDAEQARKWAEALYQNVGDEEAARGLGELIAIPGARGREAARLDVLAVGALGKVPLAALRDANGALSIARRPLVRVLALRATTPEVQGDDRAVVLADPRGDLAAATTEGLIVVGAAEKRARQVQLFGAAAEEPATLARLRASSGAGLLHVAGHVGTQGRWRALLLAGEEEINPAQIVQQGIAPRLAVLASCGSAAALDEEGWGSVASALLEAGTQMVVATDRSVPDGYALFMMQGFYSQPDWRTEPARALARVQVKLSTHVVGAGKGAPGAQTWASFVVLGRPPVVLEREVAQANRGPR
jgi:tetratricopeptide (TPR) repeat protein